MLHSYGCVRAVSNASGVAIGDSVFEGKAIRFPDIPQFLPEHFAQARAKDSSRYKQFHKGLDQLHREGVIQVMRRLDDEQTPVVAAVGMMQFEVFNHRMENEFKATVELINQPYSVACYTDEQTAERLTTYSSVRIFRRDDAKLLAAFESPYFLARLRSENPEWVLSETPVP
jgi:peptide chain release factor 3